MSYESRKDNRNDEVFAHNMKDYHEREGGWGTALEIDFAERGQPCKIIEIGADHTGGVIKGKLPPNKGDKEFVFEDGRKLRVDIKTIPEYCVHFMTFKVCCIETAIDWETVFIVPRLDCYYIFPVSTLKIMRDDRKNFPRKIYPKFSSNDLAIRPSQSVIDQWVIDKKAIVRRWQPNAQEYVSNNKDMLFREKQT